MALSGKIIITLVAHEVDDVRPGGTLQRLLDFVAQKGLGLLDLDLAPHGDEFFLDAVLRPAQRRDHLGLHQRRAVTS